MRKLPPAIFLILLFLVLSAICVSPSNRHILNELANSANSPQEIGFIAEVRWISLEGGFYGLVAEDGRKFLPLNLPEGCGKDGLKIKVRGNIRRDVATIYMWGTPLEIMEIEMVR